MKITVQYFDGCPSWVALDRTLVEALNGRADALVVHQRVETPEEAVRLGFHGSPTILVDGVDPFADEATPVGLACRVYRTPEGLVGTPTVDQLREVLRKASGRTGDGIARQDPLGGRPIACTLTPDAVQGQVTRWRAFDDAYLLDIEHTETTVAFGYAKVDDSVRRLRELVDAESACCSFVDWMIDESRAELRLVVSGTPEQLAALSIGTT